MLFAILRSVGLISVLFISILPAAESPQPLPTSEQALNQAGEFEKRILKFKESKVGVNELSSDLIKIKKKNLIKKFIKSSSSDDEIVYGTDADGNRLYDFSHAGYSGGGVRIPDVTVVEHLEASTDGSDDTKRIQEALDRIASREPDEDGFRGALLLGKGKFILSKTLTIRTSGVVLRGKGAGFGGTWIYQKTPQITDSVAPGMVHFPQPEKGILASIEVSGGGRKTQRVCDIINDLIPAGSNQIKLSEPVNLNVGDTVVVAVKPTQAWIDALTWQEQKMTDWKPQDFVFQYERKIAAINGARNIITLDSSFPNRVDRAKQYATAELQTIVSDGRVSHFGCEGIMFLSQYDRSKTDAKGYFIDENHANMALRFVNVRDSWVRNCVAMFYSYGMIRLNQDTSYVTVQDCAVLDGVSTDTPIHHSGARKYYYDMSGDRNLLQRSYARAARHAFTGNGPREGNVYLDCASEEDHLPSEWHQRWGHGLLYDNVFANGPISLAGVGNYSHGQRAAFSVMWNCMADNRRTWENDLNLNRYPGLFNNYAFGCISAGSGKIGPLIPNKDASGNIPPAYGEIGIVESPQTFVLPRSLYFAQLKDRLGDAGVRAVATPQQISGSPWDFWAKLVRVYSKVPRWQDPEQAPWPGMENWVANLE